MENYFEKLRDFEDTTIDSELGTWMFTIDEDIGVWRLFLYEEGDPEQKSELQNVSISVHTSFGHLSQKQLLDPEFAKFHPEGMMSVKCGLNFAGRTVSWTEMPISVEPESFNTDLQTVAEEYFRVSEGYIHMCCETIEKYKDIWLMQIKKNPNALKRLGPKFKKTITPTDHSVETAAESIPIKKPNLDIFSIQDALASNDENKIIEAIQFWKKLTPDQAIEVGRKAHELRSNKLLNLVKRYTQFESFNEYFGRVILEKKGTTSYGCLMAVFDKKDQKQFIDFAKKNIDKENVADDGIEDEPHVTVLYGFHGDLHKQLSSLLSKWGPVEITLGKISRFKKDEKDVIKVEAHSDDIKKLHAFLMEHYKDKITTDFPKWNGHLTLGYVKKGAHKELDGSTKFKGKKFKIPSLVYSTPGMHTKKKVQLTTD